MLFVTLGIERMFEVAVSAVFVGLGVVLWAFELLSKVVSKRISCGGLILV
jgi:hypothetical protein